MTICPNSYFFLLFTITLIFNQSNGDKLFNVMSFGANPNGVKDSTKAFIDVWAAACGSTGVVTLVVPKGTFLLSPITFRGPCRSSGISIRIAGTLVAPGYRVMGEAKNWLIFHGVKGVSVIGGTLDGNGSALWSCKAGGGNCPSGATTLSFINSNNIIVKELISLNSQMFHIVIHECEDVHVERVKIIAPGDSPNTDGIHVQSANVAIFSSSIKTGDDCVSVGPGTKNLWIQDVECGPGHGISVGSLGKGLEEEGVQNVTVQTTVFDGTQNGLRIKSWARPSKGFARGIRFIGSRMRNVQNPIIIDQDYCPDNLNCPNQDSGVKISDVIYQNIEGTSATQVAVTFNCSSESPCIGIQLENVKLAYAKERAQSSCANAVGKASGVVEPKSCLRVG